MQKKILFGSLLVALFTSCVNVAPPAPTSTPVGLLSPAIVAMDKFYTSINDAQTEDDLDIAWNMFTLVGQCSNPRDMCSLYGFQERYWSTKTSYKLYDCGSNSVLAFELHHPRNPDSPTTSTSQYWKYRLVEIDGNMMINDVRAGQGPGSDCVLVLDKSPQP